MKYLSLIIFVCLGAVVVNASESGYYIPKGYYVIHADGHQSELSKISPSHQLLLHRLRRSPQFSSSSSSSSSSSVSSNGGPVFFHQSTSSHVSPGGVSSQGYYPGVVGSLNNRFNGDDEYDDDDYDDTPIQYNNNRPGFSSIQTQTGNHAVNGINRPNYSSSQTQTGSFAGNGNTQSSGSLYRPSNGNTVHSQSSSISRPGAQGTRTQSTGVYPSANGNVVYTQTNNNGLHTQTSGVIYPNGQVQITSQKIGKF